MEKREHGKPRAKLWSSFPPREVTVGEETAEDLRSVAGMRGVPGTRRAFQEALLQTWRTKQQHGFLSVMAQVVLIKAILAKPQAEKEREKKNLSIFLKED